MNNLHHLSPYELGESRSVDALPHLVVYLHNGSDNEKRLAASALIKLIDSGVNCYSVIPFLIKNLINPKPQVRQYTLKALKQFNLTKNYANDIKNIIVKDEKDYNRELATEILLSIEREQPSLFQSESFNEEIENENIDENDQGYISETVEKGFVYFLQEDYSGRVKIGKTKDMKQRLDTFNVKLPFNVTSLHVVESQNHHYTEKLFQIHFKNKHINGEWFELSKEDILWIKSGKYTKRIMDSLVSIYQTSTKSKQHSITEKQIEFLSSLLSNHRLMLTKPLTSLNATEANALIGYLYKGSSLPKEHSSLITTRVISNI